VDDLLLVIHDNLLFFLVILSRAPWYHIKSFVSLTLLLQL